MIPSCEKLVRLGGPECESALGLGLRDLYELAEKLAPNLPEKGKAQKMRELWVDANLRSHGQQFTAHDWLYLCLNYGQDPDSWWMKDNAMPSEHHSSAFVR